MQLTRFTDYALRVLMTLAYQYDTQATISEISTMHAISENHLMKVVNQLARLGYVTTTRGKGGGLRLGRPPSQINLGDVVRHTETMDVVECFSNDYEGDCRLFPACKLKAVLENAQNRFLHVLDQYSVADLLNTRPPAAVVHVQAPPSKRRRAGA